MSTSRRLTSVHAVLVAAVLAAGAAGVVIDRSDGASSGPDLRRLPLGDGKVTTASARRGYVYACSTAPTDPNRPAGGAFRDGPWIRGDGTFDATAKVTVDGAVRWPGARVRFRRTSRGLEVVTDGLPVRQTTGTFPVSAQDDAFGYDRNPNRIQPSIVRLTLPGSPRRAARPSCLPAGVIGVAVNGVAIFNALDLADRDAKAHEIQDSCGGHPEMTSRYHYHDIPSCLTRSQSTSAHSRVVGYALDGFAIFGPRGRGGRLLRSADLDTCHGHTHEVTVGQRRATTYHYHATLEYPYTLGCFRGRPVRVVP